MKMKSCYLYCISLLFTLSTASAQKLKGYHLDISLAKFGSEIGPDKSKVYFGPLLFLNAFKVGVPIHKKLALRAGIRRQPIRFRKGEGNYTEQLDNKGFESTLGMEQKISTHSKITLFPETGIFMDYATTKGFAGQNEISKTVHHTRQYKGLYHEAKFAYFLSKHLSLLTGIRFRFGHIDSYPVPGDAGTTFQQSNGFKFTFDQVSTISIRYTL